MFRSLYISSAPSAEAEGTKQPTGCDPPEVRNRSTAIVHRSILHTVIVSMQRMITS